MGPRMSELESMLTAVVSQTCGDTLSASLKGHGEEKTDDLL